MFGLNKYLAMLLVGAIVGVWGFVTWRVIDYTQLKDKSAQQASVIKTVDVTTQAVAEANRTLDSGKADLDQALCAKGWMANCQELNKPDIARLRFVESAQVADVTVPQSDTKVAEAQPYVAPAAIPKPVAIGDCTDSKCRKEARARRDAERRPTKPTEPAKPQEVIRCCPTDNMHNGPTFGVMVH